jgi:hypothetical protein
VDDDSIDIRALNVTGLVLQGQIDDHTHPTCGDGVAPKQGHLLEQALCPRPEPSGPVVLAVAKVATLGDSALSHALLRALAASEASRDPRAAEPVAAHDSHV